MVVGQLLLQDYVCYSAKLRGSESLFVGTLKAWGILGYVLFGAFKYILAYEYRGLQETFTIGGQGVKCVQSSKIIYERL